MWELFSGGVQPYAEMDTQEVVKKVTTGYRLGRPEKCPRRVYKLMQACWNEIPEKRPSFTVEHDRDLSLISKRNFAVN